MLIKQSKKYCQCSKTFGRDCSYLLPQVSIVTSKLQHLTYLLKGLVTFEMETSMEWIFTAKR